MFLLTQDHLKIIELLTNIQPDNEEYTKINSQLIELHKKLDKLFNVPPTSIYESEIFAALKPIEDKTKKLIKLQENYIEIEKLSIDLIQETLIFNKKFREHLTYDEIEAFKIFERALEDLKANVLVLTPIVIIKSLDPNKSDFNWLNWLRDLHESLYYLLEALEEDASNFSNESLQSLKWRLETIVTIKSLRNIYKVVDEDQQKTARDYLSGVISTGKAILWEINNIEKQDKPKKIKTIDDLYNHWTHKYNLVEMEEISEILDREFG